jgi:hypothetical protein
MYNECTFGGVVSVLPINVSCKHRCPIRVIFFPWLKRILQTYVCFKGILWLSQQTTFILSDP